MAKKAKGTLAKGTMSPLLVPGALVSTRLISTLALTMAKPPLTCLPSSLDKPAGFPNTVLASNAEEARPAKAVPAPLALCSFKDKPLAKRAPLAKERLIAKALRIKGKRMVELRNFKIAPP